MHDNTYEKIRANPKYRQLVSTRDTYGWIMTILMLVVYYGFIGLIAFDKAFLARPIGEGVTTIGIPIAFGVIVFTILITGLYVRRANGEYDRITAEILQEAAE